MTTTTTTTPLPTVHLYTQCEATSYGHSGDDDDDSLVQMYRDFLTKNHGPVEETDLATKPDVYDTLRQRFPNLVLPGILLNNDVWVQGANGRELQAAWGKAWFDHVLNTPDDDDDDEDDEVSLDLCDVPFPSTLANETTFAPTPRLSHPLGETMHSGTSQSTSLYTTPSTTSSQLASIMLPNGPSVDMGALIRLLMRATHHNTTERDGHTFFYFRGYEGLELWSILFYDDPQADATDFGRMLVERGVVHNYTPNCTDFSKTFLVLQPLKEPRVLNSFVDWPTSTKADKRSKADTCSENSMDVLLRLSRLMDEICVTDYRENLALYHEFEIGCCQLQVLPLPSDVHQRIVFLLNLYNMAVRHAVIICEERRWLWPTDLANLHAFFTKTGYTINGNWVSLAEMRTSLYGMAEITMPPLRSERARFWKRWSLCRGDAMEAVDTTQFYSNRVITTDTRLLFAMTLGIKGSPSVTTIYLDRLEEGLQIAAEVFCREHVKVTDTCAILPALSSWFRYDLGDGTANMVLHSLLPFLSFDQMRGLDKMWRREILEVEFGRSDDDWKPTFSTLSTTQNSVHGEEKTCKQMETIEDKTAIPEPPLPVRHASSSFTFRKLSTLTADEFSVAPAPELHDPATEFIDQKPLNQPCSVALSTTKHRTTATDNPSLLARQPSFHQKPGVLLRRLWGRYPSMGDIAPGRPGLLDKTETQYDDEYEEDDDDDILSDDGHSFFQSVVSEITYGSEFQDLLSRRSKRRLQAVQQGQYY